MHTNIETVLSATDGLLSTNTNLQPSSCVSSVADVLGHRADTLTTTFVTTASSEALTSMHSFCSTHHQQCVYDGLKHIDPIEELQQPSHTREFFEDTIENTLYRLMERSNVIVVAGAFFGDEGKGKTVDAVARHSRCTCIARVNSGENAGHTVYDAQGRKFVFNLSPSGILLDGKRNYIGPECVMDPISFMDKEIGQLHAAGVKYHDRLFIGNVFVVTPYHKLIDLLASASNASTLKGMAPAHASKASKRGIRLDDIFNDEAELRTRLQKDMQTYFGLLAVMHLTDDDVVRRCHAENSDGVQRVPDYVVAFARATDKLSYLVHLYHERVRCNPDFPTRCDAMHELRAALARDEKVLLEGPQSYWLSNAREKFWASTTSADTSAAGLLAACQVNTQNTRVLVINVHKTPGSSRVGLGACASSYVAQDYFSSRGVRTLHDLPAGGCADFDAIQRVFFRDALASSTQGGVYNGLVRPIEYTDSTGTYNICAAMAIASAAHHGECGSVTRKPRICGFFDCVLHYEVNAVQGPYLTISAVDRGDDYDKVGVVIAYVYYDPDAHCIDASGRIYKNGDIIRAGDPVPSEAALRHCHPIVKLIDGWRDSPLSCKHRTRNAPLPRGVCELLTTIEHFTKCKILSIGNGPGSDDIIYLRQ